MQSTSEPTMRFRVPAAILLATLLLQGTSWAQTRGRALTTDDYRRFRTIQSIEASPDGKLAVVGIGTVDTVADAYTSDLWLLNPATGDFRQLTRTDAGEYDPRFSPDGKQVGFLFSGEEHTQVFGLPLTGGDAAPLFAFDGEVEAFAWFPDGKRIVFTAADP